MSEAKSVVSGPASLFDLSIQLIGHNIDLIESFIGFPSQVGEKIFQVTLETSDFRENVEYMTQGLTLFCDAFGPEVLSSLNVAGEHLGLNYSLEGVLVFTHLTCLDVSRCGLGDDHEILAHVTQLTRLEMLYMENNSITDAGVQKMTAPYRMFHRGPDRLHTLNLAGNTGVGVSCLKYLLTFQHLYKVVLSKPALLDCKQETDMHKHWTLASPDYPDLVPVQTCGWARNLVQEWMTRAKQKSTQGTKSQKTAFYFKSQLLGELKQSSQVTPTEPASYLVATRTSKKPGACDSKTTIKVMENLAAARDKLDCQYKTTVKSKVLYKNIHVPVSNYRSRTISGSESDEYISGDNSVIGTAHRRKYLLASRQNLKASTDIESAVGTSLKSESQSKIVSHNSSCQTLGRCTKASTMSKKSMISKEEMLSNEDMLAMYSGTTNTNLNNKIGLIGSLENVHVCNENTDQSVTKEYLLNCSIKKNLKVLSKYDLSNKVLMSSKKEVESNSAQPKITSLTKTSVNCKKSDKTQPLILLKPFTHVDVTDGVSKIQEHQPLKQRKKIKMLANNSSYDCQAKRKFEEGAHNEIPVTKHRKVDSEAFTGRACSAKTSVVKTSLFDALGAFD